MIAPENGRQGIVSLFCDGCRQPLNEALYADKGEDLIAVHGAVRAYHAGDCAAAAVQFTRDARMMSPIDLVHELLTSLGLTVEDLSVKRRG